MSDIPTEDIALAAETLSDDEVIVAFFAAMRETKMPFPDVLKKRMDEVEKKYRERVPLRRKLQHNPELARELISEYPVYASTSGLSYDEMVDMCVVLNLDEDEEE